MSMACSASHFENKVRMPTKIPAQPISNNGPINKPADWTAAEEALDRAIIAAHRAVKQEWASTRTLGKNQKANHESTKNIPPNEQEWVSTYDLSQVSEDRSVSDRSGCENSKQINSPPLAQEWVSTYDLTQEGGGNTRL